VTALEAQLKESEDWPAQLADLRNENKALRKDIERLQKEVHLANKFGERRDKALAKYEKGAPRT